MSVLILADHSNVAISDDLSKVVSAAARLGGEVHVLVAGKSVDEAALAAAKVQGVAKVLVAEHEALEHLLAEPLADLLVSLAAPYSALVAAASTQGKSVMPRVAALLDVMQVSEVINVVAPDTFARPTYAGNVIETVRSTDSKQVLTVRITAFDAASLASEPAPIEPLAVVLGPQPTSFVHRDLSINERPNLSSARVVVSGGRALGSADKFHAVLGPLADKLGAALGASRAAVDAGFAPNDWQVGQTGKIVAPQLYIACGISGAIQHLAGMSDSKVIVAINKDEDAPIFQVADYGIVGDLFEVVPALEQSL